MPFALLGLPLPSAAGRRRRHALAAALVILAIGLAPARARAQASPDYLKHYDAGVAAYNLGQYDKAKAELEAAVAIDPKLPGGFRWLAAVAQAQERYEDCLENSFTAVKLNPLSNKAPEVRALHAECRKALNRPEFRGEFGDGGAIVALTPGVLGATVKFNGLKYGATPMEPRAFTVGKVEVSIEHKGYLPATKTAEVLAGMVTDVVFDLQVDPNARPDGGPGEGEPKGEIKIGWVKIESNPASATITMDGKPVVLDEQGRITAEHGLHTIIVEASGFDPWRRRVRFNRGQSRTVKVNLRSTATRKGLRTKGYLALGAAGALAITGGVFGILESRAREEAEDIWDQETARPATGDTSAIPVHTREDLQDATDRGHRYALISGISFGLAAAALGTSIYFFLEERPAERKGFPLPIAVTPLVPGPGGAGVGAQVSYTTEVSW